MVSKFHEVEIEPNIDEIFDAAVYIVHNMPKEGPLTTSNSKKLSFYALYKQATTGPCNVPRPAFWNIVEKYKWDAWNALGNLNKEKAKTIYVQKMRAMIDKALEQYDVSQWMNNKEWDYLEPIMRPKFMLIGRDLFEARDLKTNNPKNQQWEQISIDENKDNILKTSTISSNQSEEPPVLSDDEYTDAYELPQSNSGPLLFFHTKGIENEELTASVLQNFLVHFQSNVNRLTQHFHSITASIMKQNQIISTLLTNMARRNDGISWKTIILILIWPLFVNFCIYLILKRRYFSN